MRLPSALEVALAAACGPGALLVAACGAPQHAAFVLI
jgi:hypothetical protein